MTAAVGIPILGLAVWAGGLAWTGLVGAIVLLGLWEWRQLLSGRGWQPGRDAFLVGAGLALTALYGWIYSALRLPSLLLVAAAGPAYLILRHPPSLGEWPRAVWTVGGLVWITAGLGHLAALREVPDGLLWVALALGITWSTDTGAYFVGRSLGGRPLAPRISPKKTVSGSLGGLIAGSLFSAVFASWALAMPLGKAGVLGLVGAACAQAGDLAESAFKRAMGAKDSGRLLPGHGGVLDRFDSLMLVAPLVYYWQRFLF